VATYKITQGRGSKEGEHWKKKKEVNNRFTETIPNNNCEMQLENGSSMPGISREDSTQIPTSAGKIKCENFLKQKEKGGREKADTSTNRRDPRKKIKGLITASPTEEKVTNERQVASSRSKGVEKEGEQGLGRGKKSWFGLGGGKKNSNTQTQRGSRHNRLNKKSTYTVSPF